LIEGAGVAGMTACIALASGGKFTFQQIWYEITTDDPTYLISCYGTQTGAYNSSGEKTIHIGSGGGLPIWFEDQASNETVVHVDDWNSYSADNINEIAVWENGIENNDSGTITIDRINSKSFSVVPDKYFGRFSAKSLPMDQQLRWEFPVAAKAVKLFSWNPSKGYPFRNWGEGAFQESTSSFTWTIEADGRYQCLRMIGKTSPNTIPAPIWRWGKDVVGFGLAEDRVGAIISFAMKYKYIVDPTDSPNLIRTITRTPSGWGTIYPVGDAIVNTTGYNTFYFIGRIDANAGSDVYDLSFSFLGSNLTLPGEIRILCFESWLGVPDQFELEPASIASSLNAQAPVPTFAASDTTPSVGGCPVWKTSTGTLTITDLDNFPPGEERVIISKGPITFDTTGTNLVGSSVDIVTATGDTTRWVSEDGTTKRLLGFVDVSIDNSLGA